jgi:phosphoribosylglycinamide formyltransferase-1
MRLAFFASGGGSNFEAILKHIQSGDLKAEPVLLITNNSRCGAVQKANQAKIPVVHLSSKTHSIPEELDQAILFSLQHSQVDLIVLAGYMKKIPDCVIEFYKNRIVNIHPALLPSFGGQGLYGIHVHEAVIAAGVQISGVTVHLVDHHYDEGGILAQRAVPVFPNDQAQDVAARVLVQEHDLYWRVIKAFSEKRVHIHKGRISIDGQL